MSVWAPLARVRSTYVILRSNPSGVSVDACSGASPSGRGSAKCGSGSATLGPILADVHEFGPAWARFRPSETDVGLLPAELDSIWGAIKPIRADFRQRWADLGLGRRCGAAQQPVSLCEFSTLGGRRPGGPAVGRGGRRTGRPARRGTSLCACLRSQAAARRRALRPWVASVASCRAARSIPLWNAHPPDLRLIHAVTHLDMDRRVCVSPSSV